MSNGKPKIAVTLDRHFSGSFEAEMQFGASPKASVEVRNASAKELCYMMALLLESVYRDETVEDMKEAGQLIAELSVLVRSMRLRGMMNNFGGDRHDG